MLQMHSKNDSSTLLSERDKEIIHRSMLGVFHERFNPKDFAVQFQTMSNVFSDSNILSGVQPYLLYFNLPKSIISHMHKPERLVLKPAADDGQGLEPAGSSGPKSFPTVKEVIDYFEQPGGDPDAGDEDSFDRHIFEKENMANLVIFEVEVGGRTCVIGGFTTNGWVTSL